MEGADFVKQRGTLQRQEIRRLLLLIVNRKYLNRFVSVHY